MGDNYIQAVSGIMHEASGLDIQTYDDGSIGIFSIGNPMTGDPFVGSGILYNPNTGEITHENSFEITPEGQTTVKETSATYGVDLNGDNRNPDLTGSDIKVPNVEGDPFAQEEGIFHMTSDDGMLEVTIYDRGRISQGAFEVQYTNPETGVMTKIAADENTVTVAEMDADGGVKQSGAIELNSFTENDFRQQPAPALSIPGLGN